MPGKASSSRIRGTRKEKTKKNALMTNRAGSLYIVCRLAVAMLTFTSAAEAFEVARRAVFDERDISATPLPHACLHVYTRLYTSIYRSC